MTPTGFRPRSPQFRRGKRSELAALWDAAQDLLYFVDELACRVRLLDERVHGAMAEPARGHQLAVTAGDQNGYVGASGLDVMMRLFPAHHRHRQIQNHEIDCPALPAEDIDGLLSVFGEKNAVSAALQRLSRDAAH